MRGVTESRPPFKTPYEQETAYGHFCLLLLCGNVTAARTEKSSTPNAQTMTAEVL